MGREASIAYFSGDAQKCCCNLFAETDPGCCSNENELVRIEDDQQTAASFLINEPERVELTNLLVEQWEATLRPSEKLFYPSDAGPPVTVPLFKKNCSYIFYDDASRLS